MRALFFLGLLVLSAPIVRAQSAAVETLPPFLQSRVVDSDPLMDFRTQNVPQGRVDRDTGVLRAAYRLVPTVPLRATHEATARAYLDAEAERFGWVTSDDLLLVREIDGHYSAHLTFQQTFGGIPVHNRFVKVNMGSDGHPSMVLSGYAPNLREADLVRLQPLVDASGAVLRAQQATRAQGISTPELVVYPSAPPRLAWRMTASLDGSMAAWEVLMDADTGEILYMVNQVVHARALPAPARSSSSTSADSAAVPAARAVVDGTGLVFDPDPLTTAGVPHGAPYVDNDDADVGVLNAQRKEVMLRDITLGDDGLYRLIGPYVEVTGDPEIGGTTWIPPAEADPNAFQYGRANDFFEAVMVYYHIDKNQRYIQSLEVGRSIGEYPIRVNPHGLGNRDNASYLQESQALAFGDGGIDDAEDAGMILHEYAHALLDESAPVSVSSFTWESRAIHEGWADYWAASYSRGLVETGVVPPGQDWRELYKWNGVTWLLLRRRQIWSGGVYPEDAECDGVVTSYCNIYEDGLLWVAAVMEIYDDLGRSVTDRLNLASHAYLSLPATFVDVAEALLQADEDLYDGEHRSVLREKLVARGYLSADDGVLSTALALTIAAPARLYEGSGTSWVRFRAGLDGAARAVDTPVTVSVTGGTAMEDADYSIRRALPSLIIPSGETSISDSLQITVINDDAVEGDETIAIEVSAMGLTSSMQNLVIIDDESTVRVDIIMADANDSGYTITATVSQNMGAPVTGVVLYHGDGMTFEMAPMEMSPEGSYTAELMAPAEGGILYYYVEATNGDGLTATYPPEGRYWDVSDYTEDSRLVFLDFEDDDAGDQSAVRHHVSYEGGALTFAEGALVLDGMDDHAEILGSSLGASEEFALEIMFNADNVDAETLDGNEEYLVAKPVECAACWEGSTFSLLWGRGSDDTYVSARFGNSEYEGGQVELEVPLPLVRGQWYHAVLQVQKEDALQRAVLQLRDGSGMLYGEDAAMLPVPPAISTYPIFMGHIGDLGFFEGRIDNVAFYNYAHFDLSSTSIEDASEVPEDYVLEQNYPNPFNPVTTIRYDLARVGHVRLEVSDLLGRRVAVLVGEVQDAGAQEVRFDAGDLPSGMYLYRLRVEDFVSVKKMVLLK